MWHAIADDAFGTTWHVAYFNPACVESLLGRLSRYQAETDAGYFNDRLAEKNDLNYEGPSLA